MCDADEVLQRIKQWREQRGSLPGSLRAELEAEGLELLEESVPASVTYRGYAVPGQRPRSGHVSARASLAVTARRIVVDGTNADDMRGHRPGATTITS